MHLAFGLGPGVATLPGMRSPAVGMEQRRAA